jgi:hypothetical protein
MVGPWGLETQTSTVKYLVVASPIASFDAIQWNSLMGAPSDARATPLLLPPKPVSHTKAGDPCIFVGHYLIKVALKKDLCPFVGDNTKLVTNDTVGYLAW